MTERRRLLALYAIGLLVYGAAALRVESPGYMDADYYYATALQLIDGQGLTEPFLWNYLDDPTGLPHISHLYWMPLPSMIAAGTMLLGDSVFRTAQLPFILLAAVLPPLSATYSHRLTRDARLAWMAGLFAAFPGFFLPFLVTIDSFAVFAIVGSASLWLMGRSVREPTIARWFISGLLIGIGALARADGLLLLSVGLLAVFWSSQRRISGSLALGLGVLAVMGPWWARNLAETGALLNPGSQRLLWMLEYDDLFAFPASDLTFARWWEAGLLAAAQARLAALSTNVQRLTAEGGMIFLAPFMLVGAIRKWRHPFVRLGIVYLGGLFVIMTLIFPYVGPRGALFHSMSAVMPMLWALAPLGIRTGVFWLGAKRNWDRRQAWQVFGTSAVVLAVLLTIGLYATRFFGEGDAWNASAQTYIAAAASIADGPESIVAVNNPPGFFAHSQISAVVIPSGTEQTFRKVVGSFDVGWVVLEANHPPSLNSLYADPNSATWLTLVETIQAPGGQQVHIFRVNR
jgi:hypothetical protein